MLISVSIESSNLQGAIDFFFPSCERFIIRPISYGRLLLAEKLL